MIPTRPGFLAVLALLAAVVGWCVVGLFDSLVGRSLPVPWTAPAALLIIALALFIWALLLRPRIQRKRGTTPVSPFVAARTAALAMAASRTGALVGGFYLGAVVAFLPSWFAEAPRERVVVGSVAVIASVLVVLAALWLERICRLPDQGEGAGDEPDEGDEEVESTPWAYSTNPPAPGAGR